MSKIVRWETPFTDTQFPSVALIVTSTANQWNNVRAVIMPQGIYKYPKYLVNFGEVIAFTCFEEADAPERDFTSAMLEEKNLCAYQYLDSPWLKSYEAWIEHCNFPNESVSSYHYLIFGGDNNIEIITTNIPTIEVIEERTVLKMECEI
ncbi:MAG: hypothetical protein WA584_05100 [Pyrinomonadaceae bacterium]